MACWVWCPVDSMLMAYLLIDSTDIHFVSTASQVMGTLEAILHKYLLWDRVTNSCVPSTGKKNGCILREASRTHVREATSCNSPSTQWEPSPVMWPRNMARSALPSLGFLPWAELPSKKTDDENLVRNLPGSHSQFIWFILCSLKPTHFP